MNIDFSTFRRFYSAGELLTTFFSLVDEVEKGFKEVLERERVITTAVSPATKLNRHYLPIMAPATRLARMISIIQGFKSSGSRMFAYRNMPAWNCNSSGYASVYATPKTDELYRMKTGTIYLSAGSGSEAYDDIGDYINAWHAADIGAKSGWKPAGTTRYKTPYSLWQFTRWSGSSADTYDIIGMFALIIYNIAFSYNYEAGTTPYDLSGVTWPDMIYSDDSGSTWNDMPVLWSDKWKKIGVNSSNGPYTASAVYDVWLRYVAPQLDGWRDTVRIVANFNKVFTFALKLWTTWQNRQMADQLYAQQVYDYWLEIFQPMMNGYNTLEGADNTSTTGNDDVPRWKHCVPAAYWTLFKTLISDHPEYTNLSSYLGLSNY